MAQNSTELLERFRAELLGIVFTTTKDLRHRAEGLGFLFMPTREVRTSPTSGHFVLDAGPVGEIHVHAVREQAWHPFLIISVHVRGGSGASPPCADTLASGMPRRLA